ncbi:hypothetical protein ACWG0P_14055 [Amedibacillus sp. YH-ame6]
MSIIKEAWIAPFLKKDTDDDDNIIFTYDKPYCFGANLNTLSGSAEMQMYGERFKNIVKCMLNMDDWFGKIHEEDRAYLYGRTPSGESVNGDQANYRVDRILCQNIKMIVYFERLPNERS